MPISFYDKYNFGWDDWNEKAIAIPIDTIEKYFEVPTLEYINVYIENKKKINEVLEWIKINLHKEINYIERGVEVLPEYNKFLILLHIITHGISFLIFTFSYFLLLILINLYMYENKNEFYFLIIMGIKNIYIKYSVLIFFFLLGLFSILFGFLLGYIIVNIINFFHCIVISAELNSYFFCIINYNFLYYYSIVYIVLLLFSVLYFYQKYSIKS